MEHTIFNNHLNCVFLLVLTFVGSLFFTFSLILNLINLVLHGIKNRIFILQSYHIWLVILSWTLFAYLKGVFN